jgi:prepilin-type N-terminal cleavage/methylation domain-containing protein
MTRRRSSSSNSNSRPAFTLVEILVVVVILGIAAAVIVPQMSTRDDLRVDGARRMIMADLIYAQNRSISTQVRHYVVFETTTNPRRYRLVTNVTKDNPLGSPIQHPVTRSDEFVVTFGENAPDKTVVTQGLDMIGLGTVAFEGAHTTICFDELGVPYYYDPNTGVSTATSTTGGSAIEVRCGTFARTVTVEPYTGEILAP